MRKQIVVFSLSAAAACAGCFSSSSGGPADAGGPEDSGSAPGFDAGTDAGTGLPPGDASPGQDAPGEGGTASTCMLTWTGGVNETTTDCTALGSWNATSQAGGVTISVLDTTILSAIALDTTSAPSVASFTLDTLAVSTSVSISGSGGYTWSAGKPASTTEQGTVMLSLTSVTPTTNVGGTQNYAVHGTVTATLAAETVIVGSGTVTSTGTVSLQGTF